MIQKNKKYLNQIFFKELNKWYVSFYLNPFVIKSEYELVYLSELLTPSSIKIKKNDYDGKTPIVSKVQFSNGKIFLRNENKTGMDLYLLQKGDLLVSKINFHQGALALNYYEKLVCSTHYQPYKINTQKVDGDFLVSVLRSKSFLNFVQYLRADGIKNEATFEFIGNLKIPLPSIEKQKILIKRFYDKMKLADEVDKKKEKLVYEIDNALFKKLKIPKTTNTVIENGLNFISFNKLNVWGTDKLLKGNVTKLLKSTFYPNHRLSDLVFVNPRTKFTLVNENTEISFIPMASVSDDYGEIKNYFTGNKQNSKGYTKFQEGDLIWARITPCMENGKSAIAKNLKNKLGYGSTEFHVLRKKRSDFKIEFLYLLLRAKILLNDAINHFTGSAGQQRVPKTYLENLIVPFPPLKIQNQIIAKISKMKNEIKSLNIKAKQAREEAIKEFDEGLFSK